MDYDVVYKKFISISEEADFPEQLGTKEKHWISNNRYLFKRGRDETGEDWAEVVASALCELLNIPHAAYCFAQDKDGRAGVITKTIVPPGGLLIHGNELMKRHGDYEYAKTYHIHKYTLKRVAGLIRHLCNDGLNPPISVKENLKESFYYFFMYLILDTLIGNQDRHHENWGIILLNNQMFLAETFDHASSLGRNDNPENKKRILSGKDKRLTIKEYCARAKTPFYNNDEEKRLTTIDACMYFSQMFHITDSIDLSVVNKENLISIFDSLPTKEIKNGPDDVSIEFAIAMILENKKRLTKGE